MSKPSNTAHDLIAFSGDSWINEGIPSIRTGSLSRLLKKSVAFGDEARAVAFVDIKMTEKTAGGAEGHPTAARSFGNRTRL
jgi:hypothetical protein